MNWLDSNSMRLTEASLDYLWEKQRIIAENIANSETPGYKAKVISFEEELDSKLSQFRSQDTPNSDAIASAIDDTNIRITVNQAESIRLDGNNVNMDAEQVELVRAQLQYQYQVAQINGEFSRLRSVLGK